jgi:NDP-sugar pyrophosphorylase family protein
VKAVVLVGGEGTRLRPLTSTTPKPLLPIVDRPLVERQLLWLAAHGVDEAVLSLGYLPEAFVEHFPGDTFEGIALRYAVEIEPLGTAGAIRFAAQEAGFDETMVVCNGDILTTLDLDELVGFHRERGASATIHLTRVDDPSAFGVVPTYDDGEVREFVEKPPRETAPTDWINAGTYVLEPEVLHRIPPTGAVSIERETFPQLLEERGSLYALPTSDYWIDIGTPEAFLLAHAEVIAGALGSPPAPGAREKTSGVWVQGGTQIAPSVVIEGPTLVGDAVVVDEGARIAGSTIGRACEIGRDAAVEGSVVFAGARLAPGVLVRGSIIGAHAAIERDAAVVDGTIVGAHATVAGGTTVTGGRVPTPVTAS